MNVQAISQRRKGGASVHTTPQPAAPRPISQPLWPSLSIVNPFSCSGDCSPLAPSHVLLVISIQIYSMVSAATSFASSTEHQSSQETRSHSPDKAAGGGWEGTWNAGEHTYVHVCACVHAHTQEVLCCILFENLKLEASFAAQFCHLMIRPGRSCYIFSSLFPIYLSCKVVMGMDRGHIEVIPQRQAIFITEQDCVLSKEWTTSYQFTISLLDTYYVPLPLHGDQDSFWLLDHMRVKCVQSRQREVLRWCFTLQELRVWLNPLFIEISMHQTNQNLWRTEALPFIVAALGGSRCVGSWLNLWGPEPAMAHQPGLLPPLTVERFWSGAWTGPASFLREWIVALPLSCFLSSRARRPVGPATPPPVDGNIYKKEGQRVQVGP